MTGQLEILILWRLFYAHILPAVDRTDNLRHRRSFFLISMRSHLVTFLHEFRFTENCEMSNILNTYFYRPIVSLIFQRGNSLENALLAE